MENGKGGRAGLFQANQEDKVQLEVPAIFFHQNIRPGNPYLTRADQSGIINLCYDN